MKIIKKSSKLDNVCYDIRGEVAREAKRLEEEGHRILKLNIGNPAPFEFDVPEEIQTDVIRNLPNAQGYSCLLYTSPSPRDKRQSHMPSSA